MAEADLFAAEAKLELDAQEAQAKIDELVADLDDERLQNIAQVRRRRHTANDTLRVWGRRGGGRGGKANALDRQVKIDELTKNQQQHLRNSSD
jgi:hypothetical protein